MYVTLTNHIKPMNTPKDIEIAHVYNLNGYQDYMNQHHYINDLGNGETKDVEPQILWLNHHFDGEYTESYLTNNNNDQLTDSFDLVLDGTPIDDWASIEAITSAIANYIKQSDDGFIEENGYNQLVEEALYQLYNVETPMELDEDTLNYLTQTDNWTTVDNGRLMVVE